MRGRMDHAVFLACRWIVFMRPSLYDELNIDIEKLCTGSDVYV